MSGSTTELNLKTAVDSDDNADYLTLSLASSLQTIDALFSNTTGHSHSGAHQGGPLGAGSIAGSALVDGSVTSVKIADGTIATVDLANAAVTNAKLGSDTARANLLTNGGFEIWQRGNGPFTTTAAYAADRWQMSINSGSLSLSRDAANVDGSQYSCSFSCTYSGTLNRLTQVVEVAPQVQGKVISVSARTRCASPNALRLNVYTDTNAGGGAGAVQATSGFDPGTNVWNTLTASLTVPVGANYLAVRFEMVATCSGNLDNVMLVVGSVAGDYVPLHPADDLARCLRYYEATVVSGNYPIMGGGPPATAGGQAYFANIPCVPKAVTPTVTVGGTWSNVNCSNPTVGGNILKNGFILNISSTAAGTTQSQPSASGYFTVEANP